MLFQKKPTTLDYDFSTLHKAFAVIRFLPDGTILDANENFTNTVGYSLNEIKGKHHRMFVDPEYAKSNEYKEFWNILGSGKFHSGEYRRVGKNKETIWIQAIYNSIFDSNGAVIQVVKIASNITEQKIKNSDFESKMIAVSRAQAVIEFDYGIIRLTID